MQSTTLKIFKRDINISPSFFGIAVFVAFVLRVSLTRFGHNFDFDSFQLVADLMQQGKTVYNETDRYNYAPIWMWVLYFLKILTGAYFRIGLSAFISLVDIGIATVLYKRGNKLASLLILFSPVCMVISGYHNQFDNLAILLGLLAVRYAETRKAYSKNGLRGLSIIETFCFALLVGISITTKHILIFFPFWFLFYQNISVKQRVLLFIIPIGLFFVSFLPYIQAKHGIIENVFHYSSALNAPFYHLFLPERIINILIFFKPLPFKSVFYACIILSGYLVRKRPLMDLLAFYCVFMTVLSCSLWTHYLILPMLFLAYFETRFWIWYNAVGLAFFIIQHDQFNLGAKLSPQYPRTIEFIEIYSYDILVIILILAVMDVARPGLLSKKTLKRIASFSL